jgi:hypothetical protein
MAEILALTVGPVYDQSGDWSNPVDEVRSELEKKPTSVGEMTGVSERAYQRHWWVGLCVASTLSAAIARQSPTYK